MKITPKILVVEDNASLREQIAQALEIEGYDVMTASDGCMGLDLACAHPPALVVSDITMPGMDGHAMLRRLRAAPAGAGLPVVFLTARVARDDVRAGMELGADDYLTKPFEMQELLRAVETRLRRKSETAAAATQPLAEERGRMLLSLPHELRTPLTGILGFAELLKEELVPGARVSAAAPEYVDNLIASGARLERLATNLVLHLHLELARRADAQERLFVDAGPADAGEHTTSVARRVAQTHDRAADLWWTPGEGAAVALSPHFLEKVLAEVFDNAFKFSAAGTAVEAALRCADGCVEWTVADRGVGVSPEESAGMAPFRQWQRETREQQGLGLGFAIARQLTEFNGGTLTLVSREGGGSVARLRLPQAEP